MKAFRPKKFIVFVLIFLNFSPPAKAFTLLELALIGLSATLGGYAKNLIDGTLKKVSTKEGQREIAHCLISMKDSCVF